MEDTLTNIFKETMQREKHELVTLFTDVVFNAFFRRNSDAMNTKDTIIMYYDREAPVNPGTLFVLNGVVYIALNKEHIEGTVYYKSGIQKTNGTLTTNKLTVSDLPIYGDTMSSAFAIDSTQFSLVDGRITFQTEDCKKAHELAIDDTFNEWGRTWKIENLYYRDGISYIVANVSVNEIVQYDYKLVLSTLSSLNVEPGATDTIKATAYINDIESVDAAITYESSDSTLATIDENGNIEYLADGEVYFTATWDAQGLSESTETVSILTAPVDETVSIYVQVTPEIYNSFEEEIPYYVTKGGVKVTDIPVSFKIENCTATATYAKYITIENVSEDKVTVLADNSHLVGKKFDLVAYNEEYNIENRQTISIIAFF
ncbi:MAG: hypothetical protein ACI4EF_02750 [Coprococcus sp.]